jgi:hypothetical protein
LGKSVVVADLGKSGVVVADVGKSLVVADLGKSLVVVAECRYMWPCGFEVLPVGEKLSDSSARIVMTWALMMESAVMLSDVFLL